jgi:dihydroneopterin aldolase
VKRVTVVKLGGSHAFAETLPSWLAAIEAGAGKTVLVAGGGPFADAVRRAQPRMGFDDRTADAMALLAMEQYAIAIAGMGRLFEVAESQSEIRESLRAGQVPVWAPSRMVRKARRARTSSPSFVAASWDVTSDSLAAWLAGTLLARRLLMIKRIDVGKDCIGRGGSAGAPITAGSLAKAGVVDCAFPRYLAASGVAGFVLGPRHRKGLAQALRDDISIGCPIGLVARPEAIHHIGVASRRGFARQGGWKGKRG